MFGEWHREDMLLLKLGSISGCVSYIPVHVSVTSYKAEVLCTMSIEQGDFLIEHIRF